jgi:aspartate aminotransferase
MRSDLGKNEIRIAYVLNEDDLRASVELLRVALEHYNDTAR